MQHRILLLRAVAITGTEQLPIEAFRQMPILHVLALLRLKIRDKQQVLLRIRVQDRATQQHRLHVKILRFIPDQAQVVHRITKDRVRALKAQQVQVVRRRLIRRQAGQVRLRHRATVIALQAGRVHRRRVAVTALRAGRVHRHRAVIARQADQVHHLRVVIAHQAGRRLAVTLHVQAVAVREEDDF
jgi:hypothetical protein